MKRDEVFEFFRRLAEANPSPTTELESGNPYQLLVAVVLSAQATDASVNIACRPLFADKASVVGLIEPAPEPVEAVAVRRAQAGLGAVGRCHGLHDLSLGDRERPCFEAAPDVSEHVSFNCSHTREPPNFVLSRQIGGIILLPGTVIRTRFHYQQA